MNFQRGRMAASVAVLLFLAWPRAAVVSAANDADPREAAVEALNQFHEWADAGEHGAGWRSYLRTGVLEEQLSLETAADPQAVRDVLDRFQGDHEELALPKVVAVRMAVSDWLSNLAAPAAEDLPALASDAKTAFQPVTVETLAEARAELAGNTRRLNAYLDTGGANGEAWKAYLLWDDLVAQLGEAATPDLAQLASVYRVFTADEVGLELGEFSNVASSLRKYIDLLAMQQTVDQPARYESELDAVAESLRRYASEPSDEDRFSIGQRLGWLESTGQAPELVDAVRRNFSRPNLLVDVSEAMLARGFARDVNRRQPVSDLILGTNISGEADTTAKLTLKLIPNAGAGEIQTVLTGTALSDTVGANGPVFIFSTGTTTFRAEKPILLNQDGFTTRPATSTATTSTRVRGISTRRSGIGSSMIQRIAWKRVAQQKSQAEYIAARHAEERLNRQFDVDADELIADANLGFLDDFRKPLLRRREFPRMLHFRTTDDRLYVTALQANRYQLGAPTAAPETSVHDLSVRLHESVLNNFAGALLAGRTYTQDDVRTLAKDLNDGELPPKFEQQENDEPWSITFERARPMTLSLGDNTIRISIRGERFTSGERQFAQMNISATYQIQRDAGQVKLVRQGELEIVPPGFVPGQDVLSAQQSALRTLIQSRLDDVFEEEIVAEGLLLPGEWEKIGRMPLSVLESGQGWLSAAWNLPSDDRVATAKDVPLE